MKIVAPIESIQKVITNGKMQTDKPSAHAQVKPNQGIGILNT